MPWTRRQVKYLLSKGSPLSGEQKTKMADELDADPGMGHKKKGSKALKHGGSVKRANQHFESETHRYNFRDHIGR